MPRTLFSLRQTSKIKKNTPSTSTAHIKITTPCSGTATVEHSFLHKHVIYKHEHARCYPLPLNPP